MPEVIEPPHAPASSAAARMHRRRRAPQRASRAMRRTASAGTSCGRRAAPGRSVRRWWSISCRACAQAAPLPRHEPVRRPAAARAPGRMPRCASAESPHEPVEAREPHATPRRAARAVYAAPSYVQPSASVVVVAPGDAYGDDGVVTAHMRDDPSWKLCQIDRARPRHTTRCGPYSYHAVRRARLSAARHLSRAIAPRRPTCSRRRQDHLDRLRSRRPASGAAARCRARARRRSTR